MPGPTEEPTRSEATPTTAALAERLEAIRIARTRAPETPSLADLARYQGRSAALKQAMRRRTDPTVATLLDEYMKRQRAQGRVLAAAGPAVFRALTKELSAQVCPVSFSRGVLTLAAPDESVRFKLDRQLRGGGRASIQSDLPKVSRIVVIVSREPFRVMSLPREQLDPVDAESERWDEVDQTGRPVSGRGHRCPECDWEFQIRVTRRDAGLGRGGARQVRVKCPNCGSVGEYRVE